MTYSILFSSHHLVKVLEWMALVALALAFWLPRTGAKWFGRVEWQLRGLALNRRRAVMVSAAFPLAARLLILPWYPPPPPQVHDEFSYLLQADTFAHGRVANPTPPFWEHFETEYILFQPSYASQYQPAQGLVLAAGEVLFHQPWWGVWLSVGFMCGAICWALTYMVPAVWALAGALGAGLQFGIFGLWMNSYFGGAVAAGAGALVAGSLARMIRRDGKTAASGALCGFGIILLFATRPFEAVLWSGVTGAYIGYKSIRARSFSSYSRAVAPFAVVFLAGTAALAWYNWRITGSALDPPYLAYRRIYGTPQPYWWQPPVKVDSFRHEELRKNYLNQVGLYDARYSASKILDAERSRLANFWRFFIGPFFTPVLFFVAFVWRDRRVRPWLFASIPFVLDKATYHAWYPSQNAPATILIVLVMVQGWRHMRVWMRGRGVGVAMSRMLLAGVCLTLVLGSLGHAIEPMLPERRAKHWAPIWESLYPARLLRDEVTAELEKIPGRHLVFVRYAPEHCYCQEWVFNSADIKDQRIVYARLYTPESDAALAAYLGDDVWVVEPDAKPFKLTRIDRPGQDLAKLLRGAAAGVSN